MIARNFLVVCMLVAVFVVLFSSHVNNQHRYGVVTRLDESYRPL
ncbi:hypothetical protein [Stappia indica]|nr:hypothetical protein [Stappia indica]